MSVGATSRIRRRQDRLRHSGVTLLELMIVVTLIALVAGLSFPSVSSGLDSIRLRSASNSIIGFLNTALDRAERRQQVIQVVISPRENAILARSADAGFQKRLDIPDSVHIVSVLPRPQNMLLQNTQNDSREFLLYPGGGIPAIAVEIASASGGHRTVRIDPITGTPLAANPLQGAK